MSRTFGQWFRFLGACVVVGFLVSTMCASLGATRGEVRSEVRMSVDFTVLPIVLPDGTETPASVDSDAIEGEETLPPETPASQQAVAPPAPSVEPVPEQPVQPPSEPASASVPEPVIVPAPAPEPVPAPEPAPAPKPAPAPPVAAPAGSGNITAVSLAENDNGFTLTIRADRPVGDTSYMNLDGPRRLVVDLRGEWKLATRNVVRSKGAVKHIVMGEHPDRLRLVVHFTRPPKGRLAPLFTNSGTTLEVVVAFP